jgi:hypothetical protein
MQMGESQYHSRLAVRIAEDGPLSYSGWIDKLSMHPSANRPSDLHPPGTHLLAAAGLFVERLFSYSSYSLYYIAPATHCILLLLMYVHAALSPRALGHNSALMYSLTRTLTRSPTPALVAVALCAVMPALQKQSFPGLLSPAVFEPAAAAAASVAYLRLMAMPIARNVALVILAMVAVALTCETFVSIVCLISISFFREVFSSRVDKCGLQQRLAQVTCVVDVLAVKGRVLCARARQCSPCNPKLTCIVSAIVILGMAWYGLPLALPPQPSLLYLPPIACLVLVLLYGRKAVDFFYTNRVIVKPVISLRAVVLLSLFFLTSAVAAFAGSPRLQPPAFPPTNVIRCHIFSAPKPFPLDFCHREYGASALGFSSFCALLKDILLGRDSRLPLVGSQANRLPPTWAAMWIDFHVVLLLLPAALMNAPELERAPKDASPHHKREVDMANAASSHATCLFNTGASLFFVLTCCSRVFAPTFAVFAIPSVSTVICSIVARLLEHSSTVSWTKRKKHAVVSDIAVNALLALCVFAASMLVKSRCAPGPLHFLTAAQAAASQPLGRTPHLLPAPSFYSNCSCSPYCHLIEHNRPSCSHNAGFC